MLNTFICTTFNILRKFKIYFGNKNNKWHHTRCSRSSHFSLKSFIYINSSDIQSCSGHTDQSNERIKIPPIWVEMFYFIFNCPLHLFIRIIFLLNFNSANLQPSSSIQWKRNLRKGKIFEWILPPLLLPMKTFPMLITTGFSSEVWENQTSQVW